MRQDRRESSGWQVRVPSERWVYGGPVHKRGVHYSQFN